MKIIVAKRTYTYTQDGVKITTHEGQIKGFCLGDDSDLSYLDNSTEAEVITIKGLEELPAEPRFCKWDGKKIIVDLSFKSEYETRQEKLKLIEARENMIIKAQAIQELTDEGIISDQL